MTVPPAPTARRDDTADELHGVAVPDPYRWLEDAGSAATRAWTEAHNARTRAVLDGRPGRADLVARFADLFSAGTAGAPAIRGGRLFSIDRWGGREQAALVVRELAGDSPPAARVLVDPHNLTGDATAALDWYAPSVDGRLVAFGTSTGGDEWSTLGVVVTDTGARRAEAIPRTRAASVAWAPDGAAFAYTRYPDPAAVGEDEANYHRTVWWHVLGTDPAADPVVFDDLPDKTAWPSVELSRDGRWLLVELSLGWSRVDIHLIDRTTGARTTVIEGAEAVSSFTVVDDLLVGHTTLDAPRGRVVVAPVTAPTPDRWRTVVAESDDVIEGLAVTGASLLVASTRQSVARLRRLPRAALAGVDGGVGPVPAADLAEVALPEPGSLVGVAGDRDAERAVIAFTSWTRPTDLWRWDGQGLIRWSDLPSAVDPSAYAVTAERYPSTDGTAITLFTVRRAGVEPGPGTPTVLTGYGGFSVTNSPVYNPFAVAVADDGGVYAVACIRGGAEEGEDWHRAGMREHKQQVFDDFAAAGDWLVAEGRTAPERLAIRGGSNGGLLVAVTQTQRPDLCRAVVCAVPLTDMVRFPRFLIARLWTPEYGDPDVAEEFGWLWAYSPYHHLVDGTCYPATLVLTGESDGRVDPAHARKYGAALAAATVCPEDRPVLVRVESRAGHGQGKPVSKQAEEAADVQAFLRWQIGLGRGTSVTVVRTGGDAARVVELAIGDAPAAWRSVGFAVGDDATCRVGTVRLHLAGRDAGPGLLGWTLTGGLPAGPGAIDGVPTAGAPDPESEPGDPGPPPDHANGVRLIDHLVAVTPDVDRTTAALAAWGVEARRTREAGRGRLQRFFRLGEVILELLGPAEPAGDGPARLWGLAFTVADIDATARSLAGRIGDVKDAVQPGRRIATLHVGDEVSVPVAFMSAGDARRGTGQASR